MKHGMSYGDALTTAIDHLINAFGDKVRAGPDKVPSYTHPLRVGLALIQYGCKLEVILAGIHHDSTEDTKMSLTMINRLFNRRTSYLVEQCSHDPKLGDTPEGDRELLERVVALAAQGDTDPLLIKVVDRNDNLMTNENLKEVYQHRQYLGAKFLLEAGRKYLPGHRAVEVFAATVEYERKRLGY